MNPEGLRFPNAKSHTRLRHVYAIGWHVFLVQSWWPDQYEPFLDILRGESSFLSPLSVASNQPPINP